MSFFAEVAQEATPREAVDTTASISELIVKHTAKKGAKAFVSIEFFPPKTPEGVHGLFEVLEKLKVYEPLFADVTWGAGGSTSDLTLQICTQIASQGVVPNLHLTCTNMEPKLIDQALEGCRAAGIKNILALRGDPPAGQKDWVAQDSNLCCALDLVRYIKKNYEADNFCIAVSGYPEGHPTKMSLVSGGIEALSPTELQRYSIEVDETTDSTSVYVCRDADYALEIEYLKQKVDAGASVIVTQMFFDAEVFITFVEDCRRAGILCAILPGIMCISTYAGFKRMTKFCKSRVTEELAAKLEAIKNDEAAVKEFGISFGAAMCRRLIAAGAVGLHFYTLNSSFVTRAIIEQIRDVVAVPALLAPLPV